MIEHNVSINVNENMGVIMNFIINHMDEYVSSGKIKSIRKVETHEVSNLENNTQKIKRYYFFAPILPEFINNIIGNGLDLFLTYSEEIIFDFEDNTSKTMIEQVNNFYNGKYDVKYTKIDDENTTVDITFTFELLLQSYSLFTFSTIMETIISQIFCAEMKNFYNNLGNDIKDFYNNTSLHNIINNNTDNTNNTDNNTDNIIHNDISYSKIKKHKKSKSHKILS
jgi:hypothetical protein